MTKTAKSKLNLVVLLIIFVALVFLQTKCFRNVMLQMYPTQYSEDVFMNSQEFGIDPYLIFAIIKTESNFRPEVTSTADARGIMQITPDTFDWLQTKLKEQSDVDKEKLYSPSLNIRYGTYFISILQDEFTDYEKVISAYHAGRGTVNKWLDDKNISADGKKLSRIPYPSTAEYVKRVMKNYQIYKNLYQ